MVLMVATALLDHTVAPHSPETRSDRTLGVFFLEMRGPQMTTNLDPGYAFLDRYVRPLAALPNVEKIAFVSLADPVVSYLKGRKIESDLMRTDGAFWQVMDFQFLEGGPFSAED
jgi:putative ABC transport system permease protein